MKLDLRIFKNNLTTLNNYLGNIAMGLYQTLFKSFPLISILLVGGATLAFWWAYYKDRKKLLAVNYLSDLLGRINKEKEGNIK
ncbi:hypothetical protein BG30_01995 [Bacillus subtilis subsp. subtilis]|nr:hypothetical protein BG30_01995 [Bacillus subtilis subsp. subtilis]